MSAKALKNLAYHLVVCIGSLWGSQFSKAQEQASITFELLSGSKLTHSWGNTDEFCHGGGEVIVDIVGSFTMALSQGIQSTGGAINSVDFKSTGEEKYEVTGEGSYAESRSGSSPTAEPPNATFMQLIVTVNQTIANIRLGVEPVGINDFTFPRIEAILFQQSSMNRRDCFLLGIQARPIESDLIKFFRRGDANGDGERNLTDAVFTLSYLFQAGEAPSCLDAADANDDGAIDLTDAVRLLNHLFEGGPLPPLPTTFCGVDTTEDSLDCGGQPSCMKDE